MDRLFDRIERGCAFVAVSFAVWTLLCHLVVFVIGGSFALLQWLGWLAPLAGGLIAWKLWPASGGGGETSAAAPEPEPVARIERVGFLLGVCVVLFALYLTEDFAIAWALAVALLAVAYALRLRHAPPLALADPAPLRGELVALAAIAVAAAVITSIAHRPDTDDGFLLNLSIHALEHPSDRVLYTDTLHNLAGLPLALPTYRLHAVELAYAFLGWITGLEPMLVAHVLLPPLAAIFAIASVALLARALAGRWWLMLVVAVVGFWLGMGDTHSGFANHAFVRLFQGKAVMVTAVIPLLLLWGLRLMSGGGWRTWVFLAAGQIACLGLSATALFVVPLSVGLAALAAWRPTRTSTLRLVATAAASIYLVLVALALRGAFAAQMPALNSEALYGVRKNFENSFDQVFGFDQFMLVHIGGALAAWTLVRDPRLRRFLCGWVLAFFALILNPFTFDVWIDHVTSGPVAFRLFWTLPFPLLVGVALAAPAAALAGWRRWAALAAAMLVCFVVIPEKSTLSPANHVYFAAPGRKVPPEEFRIAEEVVAATPEGMTVLAPREIVMWVTTRPGYPRVIAHKYNHLHVIRPIMGEGQFKMRGALFAYIQGHRRSPGVGRLLVAAVKRERIGCVVVARRVRWFAEIAGILGALGFEARDLGDYVMWVAPAKISAQ